MKSSVKDILSNIVTYLSNEEVILFNKNRDGRINSIENESEVISILAKKFDIKVPESSRHWADIFVDGEPVNIKITTTKTADNASSKEGVFYALTGCIYTKPNDYETYLKTLKEHLSDTDKDYYFLIINKDNNKEVFFNSLKCLSKITPNGNNLPFQIKWIDNKQIIDRDFVGAKSLIMTNLGKSIKLRTDAYTSFQR